MTLPNRKTQTAHGPLSHLRVLDMTQFLSGPFGTQILADLGAEVIKVESPDGDMTRRLPPHFVGSESCYYLSINRNKKSLAIDLKTTEGQKLLFALALKCNVVVENFRPGVLERLGLSYDFLSKRDPSIVWASISGFGQTGPYRDRPAYDMIVQAMSGGMSLTGEADGPPVRSGIPIGDLSAGLYAVIGILAAVGDSHRTGRGRFIDVAMLDCQIAMLSYQGAYYLNSGTVPGRQGTGHDSIPTYRSFQCADGTSLVITANTERMWEGLCSVLGLSHLVVDTRFSTNARRYQNREELWSILTSCFMTRRADKWVDALLTAQVPAAEVATLEKSLSDPQVVHRNMILSLNSTDGKPLRVVGNPIKFLGEHEGGNSPPPALGEDIGQVLSELLGLSPDDIAAFCRAGVIASAQKVGKNADQ